MGKQEAPPLAESDSQSGGGGTVCNRGGSEWMDESDIFRGQGPGVCVCVYERACL